MLCNPIHMPKPTKAGLCSLLLALLMLTALLSGCTPSRVVVLMPDVNGHIGKAEVTTEGGKILLDKASEMTAVTDKSSPPKPAKIVDNKYIADKFKDVLDITPLPAIKYILFFETDSIQLVAESTHFIRRIIQSITDRKSVLITISGHSDSVGSVEANNLLSLERAKSIKDLLVQNGIASESITVASYGLTLPLVPVRNGVPMSQNRRVEVVIH